MLQVKCIDRARLYYLVGFAVRYATEYVWVCLHLGLRRLAVENKSSVLLLQERDSDKRHSFVPKRSQKRTMYNLSKPNGNYVYHSP